MVLIGISLVTSDAEPFFIHMSAVSMSSLQTRLRHLEKAPAMFGRVEGGTVLVLQVLGGAHECSSLLLGCGSLGGR